MCFSSIRRMKPSTKLKSFLTASPPGTTTGARASSACAEWTAKNASISLASSGLVDATWLSTNTSTRCRRVSPRRWKVSISTRLPGRNKPWVKVTGKSQVTAIVC
jgi:hypothetical protein